MWCNGAAESIYIACTFSDEKIVVGGLDLRNKSGRKALNGLDHGLKKSGFGQACVDDPEIIKAVRQIINNVRKFDPEMDSSESVILALSGCQVREGDPDPEKWRLARKFRVNQVYLIPESRAENLMNRCLSGGNFKTQKFLQEKQDRIDRICGGTFIAAVVDGQKDMPPNQIRHRICLTYLMETEKTENEIAGSMVDWMYKRFFTGISSWKRRMAEENSLQALYDRILRFSSVRVYENYTELDGIYQQYYLESRENYLQKIWELTVDSEFKGKGGVFQELYEKFRKETSGLLLPEGLREVKQAGFITFMARQILEMIMERSGKKLDDPISDEEAERMIECLAAREFRGEVKEELEYFTSRQVKKIWRNCLESAEFQMELDKTAQIADDVLFDRLPVPEECGTDYSLWEKDGFVAKVYSSHAEIFGYHGDITHMIIPSEFRNKPVRRVELKEPVSAGCREFRVPEGVEEICVDFSECIYIEVMEMPDGVSVHAEPHAGYHLREHSWLKGRDIIKDGILYGGGFRSREDPDFTIPDGVHEIEYKACSDFAVVNLTVPGSVEVIGEAAFQGCRNLKTVRILDGVLLIKKDAFAQCPELETVVIPDSVLEISPDAFRGCGKLKKLEYPAPEGRGKKTGGRDEGNQPYDREEG